MTRKLASIRRISSLSPIPNADFIELAKVDGWQVIVKKGEFEVNDLVVYFEIDSFVPTFVCPFLKNQREYNSVMGSHLKTIKLKGVISQGLILPRSVCTSVLHKEGMDVTSELEVQLYEKPIPAQLSGIAKGNFPSFIPKTDQERIQNISDELWSKYRTVQWEVTEKLDGSSMTMYFKDGMFGVCSRNLELDRSQENNTFVQVASAYEDLMSEFEANIAVQGELVGPGIQGNHYRLSKPEFYLYNVYDIDAQRYISPAKARVMAIQLDMHYVPVIHEKTLLPETKEEVLMSADSFSWLNDSLIPNEGVVYKSSLGSFKAISNKWLLNEK
jgi:RNA ligase (TIGR02306 family)